jgi:uncharacterized membrane protein (UPF0127 family)
LPAMRIETWCDSAGARWTVAIAETRFERRRGLLGLDTPSPGSGLLLTPCRSVHTVGMAFPIDAVALDSSFVVRRVATLAPGRVLIARPGVRHVLELPAGSGVIVGTRFAPADPREPIRLATG